VWKTLQQARQLSELFKFLIAWFIYSDSFSTVVSASLLFAQTELSADLVILLSAAILVTLFAGIGAKLWYLAQMKFKITTKNIILIQAALYSLLPLYGLLGFFTPKGTFLGLNNKYELLITGAWHGLLLGATQSSCRVLFSELLPRGREAEFFGLYGNLYI
jgi:UMF1 family MFS transporter